MKQHLYQKSRLSKAIKLALAGASLSVQTLLFISPVQAADTDTEEVHDTGSIVVTGQKFERSAQETKESVEILTSERIEQQGLQDIRDVLEQTPGVSGGGTRTFQIRGIDSGNPLQLRPELASIAVDGVSLSGWVKSEGPRQLWDVEQVEVLRGPQSTNLGRNALAGAIVVKTKDPVYENSGKVQVGVSEFGGREIRGVANVSLIDGESALRFTFEDTESDGQTYNSTRQEDDFAFEDRQSFRLKWLWEPNEDLRLLLSIQDISNGLGNDRQYVPAGADPFDRTTESDVRGFSYLDAQIASLLIDYRLNDNWQLKSITALQDGERDRQNDTDVTALSPGEIVQYNEDENFSQELRFNYDGGDTRSSSGIYLAREKSLFRNVTQEQLNLEQAVNLQSPGGGTLLAGFGLIPSIYRYSNTPVGESETDTIALFSEWEFDIQENWRIDVGARYQREEQDLTFSTEHTTSTPVTNPLMRPDVQGIINLLNANFQNVAQQTSSQNFTEFLPHIGVTYFFNDDISLSLFYKQGYRSGGTEVTLNGVANDYDSETLDNYEIAFRSILFDGKGTFNANAYYGEWEDQQVNVQIPGSVFSRIDNAGESKIYGVEAALTYAFSDQFTVFASAALNETEFVDFETTDGNLKGNEFANAPEVTASLGGHYEFGKGFALNANINYQGDSWADAANTLRLDDFTTVNVRGTYTQRDFEAELYVNNLFDEDYETSASTSVIDLTIDDDRNVSVGDGQEFGARITYNF